MFRGANTLLLDAKGRLLVPSRYRAELLSASAGQLVVTLDALEPCLSLYPLAAWVPLEQRLRALPSLRAESRRLQRVLIGHATDVEMDAAGRLLIPAELRALAGLAREVTLVGQLHRFQLWDAAAWAACLQDDLGSLREPGVLPDDLLDLML